MWGKRQRDDDWDGDRGNQPEDHRDHRSGDRRGGGYWEEPGDWAAGNGNRQGFGDQGFAEGGRRGFGDDDRQGFGDPSWGQQQQRRGRPEFGNGSFGPEGGPAGERGFDEPGFNPSASSNGFGGARQDGWQGDPRRPMRNFPEGGFGQSGRGGRGGDFGGGDFAVGDFGGSDFGPQEPDQRDVDRRDGSQWNDAGGWGQPEPEVSAPVFTPAGQAPSPVPVPVGVPANGTSTRPYGRLSIFTLHDDRAAEFDRLAEQAADAVSMLEPDTLVYVMHNVPKAPMQRIIYEIYRDHAAFESHQRQPHILEFEEGRRPCVLVTNIIDLRLKYAKVAPLQGAMPQPPVARPQLPASPSQPGLASRHRAQQSGEPEGGWFGQRPDDRSPDSDGGDWGADRSFGSGDRRSQEWGQPQYSGQRYRDN
ncbi:MAG TPA: antibiotic biosynthesis monooxygenase [Trebonia sp.]|nr:antibiotic biosynthesis monooxygenase [Trebonia sp.]